MRPTVVLLHAFPLDPRMWDVQRMTLELAGWPVATPTLPPPGAASSFADWADRVLAEVEGPIVPVGLSMGGYLSFELWRRAAGRIRALVLCDTRAGAETPDGRAGRDDAIELVRSRGVGALIRAMQPRAFAPSASPAAVERFRQIALDQDADRVVASIETIRDRADATALLPTIVRPTLVVCGTEDVITPLDDAEAMAAALPDASLLPITGVGHLPALEAPEQLADAIAGFLRARLPD